MRSHEIASACANSLQVYTIFVKAHLLSKDKSAEEQQSTCIRTSKEDLSRDEMRKSTAKPPLPKGGKRTTTALASTRGSLTWQICLPHILTATETNSRAMIVIFSVFPIQTEVHRLKRFWIGRCGRFRKEKEA